MRPVRRLDDVCEISMGQAPDGGAYNDSGDGWPLIAGAGDFGVLHPAPKKFTTEASKLSKVGDIILGIRATIGEKVLSNGEYCLGRGVAGLRAKSILDTRYLWHWLSHIRPTLASKGKGATFKQVNKQDIGELEIALPPVSEQRRIAAILDQADALRAKRRQALALLDELQRGIFIDMFGDPATNPKNWPTVAFESLCSRVTVGIVVQPSSYYQPTGVVALRSLNIRPGKIVLDDVVYFSEQDNETRLKKTRLRAGDLVLVRTGQPGTAAVVPEFLDGVNAIDILIATPDAGKCKVAYLCEFFNSKGGRSLVLSAQRGQIQKHLNVGALCSASIPLPPLEIQKEFAGRLAALQRVRNMHLAAIDESDYLFRALQHRGFRGEL